MASATNVAFAFKRGGHEAYFYWYVSAVCAVSLITALLMRDVRHHDPLAAPRGG